MSFRAFLQFLNAMRSSSVHSILSAEDRPATMFSRGDNKTAYRGTHSVSCLNEPNQLRVCFTVSGGAALISGEIVWDVGDQPASVFFLQIKLCLQVQ